MLCPLDLKSYANKDIINNLYYIHILIALRLLINQSDQYSVNTVQSLQTKQQCVP